MIGAPPMGSALLVTEIQTFFQILHAQYPHAQTELNSSNPFTFLVAVVLSAQATDRSVNQATPPLFQKADSPQKMADLGIDELIPYIRRIGLYRSKAQHIIMLSQQLLDRHNGQIPQNREALEKLAGVGRKTANVFLNVIAGQETFPVDTHVFRVSNRTGLAPGRTPLAVEKALDATIPQPWRHWSHHGLILHGRYVCQAKKPACHTCSVRTLCRDYKSTLN